MEYRYLTLVNMKVYENTRRIRYRVANTVIGAENNEIPQTVLFCLCDHFEASNKLASVPLGSLAWGPLPSQSIHKTVTRTKSPPRPLNTETKDKQYRSRLWVD